MGALLKERGGCAFGRLKEDCLGKYPLKANDGHSSSGVGQHDVLPSYHIFLSM